MENKLREIKELEDKYNEFEVHSCEVYSRVTGYCRPVNQWNKGKQQEFKERALYDTVIGVLHE